MDTIECKQCGGTMREKDQVKQDRGVQVVALLLFLVGLALLAFFPLGTIAGVLVMIFTWRMGYKTIRTWVCESCGYFFERA